MKVKIVGVSKVTNHIYLKVDHPGAETYCVFIFKTLPPEVALEAMNTLGKERIEEELRGRPKK